MARRAVTLQINEVQPLGTTFPALAGQDGQKGHGHGSSGDVHRSLCPDLAACARVWVEPTLGDTVAPDPALTARILRRETIEWEGRPVEAWVAAVQEDPADPLRRSARAWIAPDGKVLQEEHRVLSWTFTFRREKPPDQTSWTPWH